MRDESRALVPRNAVRLATNGSFVIDIAITAPKKDDSSTPSNPASQWLLA